jgi:hypothetical protein
MSASTDTRKSIIKLILYMNTKYNISMLLIWIILSVICYFAIQKYGAPDWAKILLFFNATGFFLIFINQALLDLRNDINN